MPNLHPDDASAFIVDYIRRPRNDGYSSYGYEIYLPNIIVAYIQEAEKSTEHVSHLHGGQRARDLSPAFYEAAWTLCRRGLLRPGVRRLGEQATEDGSGGQRLLAHVDRTTMA